MRILPASRVDAATKEEPLADEFQTSFDVLKVDESLGLVFGWGIICAKNGQPYSDRDKERVTPSEMLKSVTDFAAHAERPTDDMHDGKADGSVIHSFPLTSEIAKVFGIECATEGWMVAVKPSAEVLAKFVDGTYTGFSVGGTVGGWEPDEEAAA